MNKEEFVARSIAAFPQLKEVEYISAFEQDIGECFDRGWEYKDVLSYLRTFEEVSPIPDDTDEEQAMRLEAMYLERRARIEAKYLDGNVELHVVRFEALAPMISR